MKYISYAPLVSYLTKKRILERDNYICQYCGGRATTIDHVIPRSILGASNKEENLVAACQRCNNKLSNRSFAGFYSKKLFIWNYLEKIGEMGNFSSLK